MVYTENVFYTEKKPIISVTKTMAKTENRRFKRIYGFGFYEVPYELYPSNKIKVYTNRPL
jgi:hypothetical protein